MELKVSQVIENNQYYVKIEKSKDFNNFVWEELLKTIKQFQDSNFIEENNDVIISYFYEVNYEI